jgi:GNAT superfamily N-acetyltransferase
MCAVSRTNPAHSHPIRVRPFKPADRDAIMGLAPRFAIGIAPWRDPEAMMAAARGWIEGSIAAIGPERTVLVAENTQGRCIGFVSVGGNTNFTGEVQAYIGELAVAEHAEGRGVGSALISAAEEWARDKGYKLVVLDTGAANVRARAFYARLGYVEESVKLAKVLDSRRE